MELVNTLFASLVGTDPFTGVDITIANCKSAYWDEGIVQQLINQALDEGEKFVGLAEAEIMARIDAALTLTECQPLRHRHPATLSGGETQRVVIACAIAMQPKLLILDEAFSRLTPQASEMLLQRLQHWAFERGSLIILFERHRTPFLNYCQQAWQLQNGALQPLC